MLLMFGIGEDGKMARESALAIHFIFGFLLATLITSSSIARDINNGTALTILSKPVNRSSYVLSKFFGIALVIVIYSMICLCSSLISERISEHFQMSATAFGYITDWQTAQIALSAISASLLLASVINYKTKALFSSIAFWLLPAALLATILICSFFERNGNAGSFDMRLDLRIVPVSILITLGLIVLASISTTLSTRLSPVLSTILTFMIFTAGLVSPQVFADNQATHDIWSIAYRFLPGWQTFWTSEALTANGTVPWSYVMHTASYAFYYASGVLILGIFSFRSIDLK